MCVQSGTELVLRGFNFCIIDEVDSILVDEARTPLIISGASFASPTFRISQQDQIFLCPSCICLCLSFIKLVQAVFPTTVTFDPWGSVLVLLYAWLPLHAAACHLSVHPLVHSLNDLW